MKIEIPLHPSSDDLIQETFSRYTEITKLPQKITGRTVIHMYPLEDTRYWSTDDDYGLDGFTDAMNCELHIYDVENETVFKTKFHDQIDISVPSRARVFKDLSTMIIIDKPVRLWNLKSFDVRELR